MKKDRVFIKMGQPLPPSARRVDLGAFATKSLAWGTATFAGSLIALWRRLGDWPAPHGELSAHAWRWAACVLQDFFPSLLSNQADAYRAHLSALNSTDTLALWGRVGIAGACALVSVVVAAWRHLRPHDAMLFTRGSKRYEGAEAVKRLRRRLAKRVAQRPDHELAPGVQYSSDLWCRHALLVGGTGAGKSTVIKPLLSKIIKGNESLLLFDPKGDFTKAFSEPILLAPWDKRSWAWDIGADIRNIGAARRFATALIREGNDPMWANAARQVLVGAIMALRAEFDEAWGWSELAETLALSQPRLLPLMQRHHPEAVRAVERASVTTQGVLINLSAFCSAIHDLANAWGDIPRERRVSFTAWLTDPARSPRQIILQGNGSYPEITRGYTEGIFSVIGGLVNSVEIDDDPQRKVWIVLDELPQCGKVPILPLFSVGRSRGVRCVAACQDLSQLEEVHGKEAVRSLVSMTGSILIGQMSQGDTADALAKALGSREVERRNESRDLAKEGAGSFSYAREDLSLYKPSELGSRLGLNSARKGVVLALALEGDAYELFWPFQNFLDKRMAHIPSVWALGTRHGRNAKHDELGSRSHRELGATSELLAADQESFPGGVNEEALWRLLAPAQAQSVGADDWPLSEMEANELASLSDASMSDDQADGVPGTESEKG